MVAGRQLLDFPVLRNDSPVELVVVDCSALRYMMFS